MSYYNLEQTLEVFQKNLPEALLPFGLTQLADLCRRGELTPVFPYAGYVSKGFFNENEQLVSTKKNTKSFKGYLTSPDLIDLIFQLTETVVTSSAYIYEEIGTKDKGELVTLEKWGYDDRNDYYHELAYPDGLSSGDNHYIGINNLLFPIEQVQAYIASKRTDKLDNQTPTPTIGTFGNPTVKHGEPKTYEQLREALTAANATIKQQEKDINRLNDQLKEQAKKLTDTSDLLSDRNEQSYQTTIGLLLELMTVPKIEGDRPPFTSEAVIIGKITDKSIYGQGKTTLETRFRDAKTTLTEIKKKAFRP